MATDPKTRGPARQPSVATVDALVDENGSRIVVPDGSSLKIAGEHDAVVGATSPTNWWFYGLVGLAVVVALLLVLQIFQGAPSTSVQPGTPSAESVVAPATDPAVPVQEPIVPTQ